jgi:hypothetical protein
MADESASATGLDQMDRWSRNQRLYETLRSIGLFVSPVPEEDDPTKIRYLIVSADLPPLAETADERPAARATAARERSNVVDFPTTV